MSATVPRRRRSPYRKCQRTDPRYGPVCGCGAAKSVQAFTCQACHSLIRGYGTVTLAEQNRRWRRTYLGIVGAVGDPDRGAVYLADALERACAAALAQGGELAALVADQACDARQRRWQHRGVLSPDAPGLFGHTLHERTAG